MADYESDLLQQPQAPQPQAAPQPAAPAYQSDLLSTQPAAAGQEEGGYGIPMTATLHGLHGLSGGFSDELHGLIRAGGGNSLWGLARLGYEKLTGSDEGYKEYKKARDEYRKRLEKSAEEHPVVAPVADIAGSMAMPAGSLAGAKWGERAIRGAYSGAAQGALRGAGEAQEASDIPQAVASGALTGAALGAPTNAIFGSRVTSAAKQQLLDAANKYGVKLPLYMVSENPIVQFYGKTFEQLPFVGPKLGASAEVAKEGVKKIRDDMIEKAIGYGATPSEARDIASKAATVARDQFVAGSKKVSDQNFTAITNSLGNPNFKIQPGNLMQEVVDQANRIGAYGGNPGPVLQRAIDAIKVPGGLNYQAMKDLRTSLYNKFREGASDIDKASLTRLTQALTKDMEHTIFVAGGPNSVNLWNRANLQHAAGKDIAEQLGQAIGKGTSDTAAADTIFRNINAAKPNIAAVTQLRNTMHPDEWAKVQASVLARMGGDETGGFSIAKFLTANSKMPEAGKTAMFGAPGTAKRDAYDAIVKIGGAMGKLNKFVNYSNTALMGSGIGLLYELWHDPVSGAEELLGGSALAAILARPATARSAGKFASAFDKFVSRPTAYAVGQIPRALEVAGRNLAITLANGGQ